MPSLSARYGQFAVGVHGLGVCLGSAIVIVLGDPGHYRQFRFQPASR